jgi:acetyl-CoA carboxylase biotin carboxyl carrier protein
MNIKEVKDLIQDILQSDISEFELEHTGTKVRLKRGVAPEGHFSVPTAQFAAKPVSGSLESSPQVAISAVSPSNPRGEIVHEENLHIITSPIVGTFYRAASPAAELFVKPGSKIEIGTTLCIVEAMKLMNEIPSDAAGEVVEIYTENGHPVEFGQKLFGIRLR